MMVRIQINWNFHALLVGTKDGTTTLEYNEVVS